MFKNTTKILALLFVFASITFFIGCQEQQSVTSPDAGVTRLSKDLSFTMPAGATLSSASLKLYAWSWAGNPQTVEVHSITADWSCPVTWNSFAGAFNPANITTFNTGAVSPEWKTIDITSTVQAWIDGGMNYGVLLKNQDIAQGLAQWLSNEYVADPALRPYLEIVTSAGTFEIEPLYDTYVQSIDPGNSYCDEEKLYVGMVDLGTGPTHKYTLIRFTIEQTPPEVSCETAFAYDEAPEGTCFLDLGFNRWGWSIYLAEPGTYTFPVYAGAGQCDLTKGTYVGDVTAVYSGGTVEFTYEFEPGFSAEETHFYAGYNEVASDKKGNPTVAPGQYKIGTGLSGGIYIIAHAVVCSSDWD